MWSTLEGALALVFVVHPVAVSAEEGINNDNKETENNPYFFVGCLVQAWGKKNTTGNSGWTQLRTCASTDPPSDTKHHSTHAHT